MGAYVANACIGVKSCCAYCGAEREQIRRLYCEGRERIRLGGYPRHLRTQSEVLEYRQQAATRHQTTKPLTDHCHARHVHKEREYAHVEGRKGYHQHQYYT